jgi:cation diffusion facilitator family transporter
MALKAAAYFITGSVGLLSDALESLVNLAGGIMALAMLSVAARPADDTHAYGHYKAEYFSSALEGLLILVAAAGIGSAAMHRLISPQPLEQVGAGIVVCAVAAAINLVAGWLLLRAARAPAAAQLARRRAPGTADDAATAGPAARRRAAARARLGKRGPGAAAAGRRHRARAASGGDR